MKLILGTVQLGKKYSKFIEDKVDNDEAIKILSHSIKNNILTFDTAQIYGNSEKLLSNISDNDNVRIITKIHFTDINSMENEINHSLKNLNLKKLDTVMFHNYKSFKDKNIVNNLIKIKNNGIIKNLGVSVYTVEEAIDVLKSKEFSVLQIPFNYLDRQWDNVKFLNLINQRSDIEIHIRSIFLQGILVNEHKYWPTVENEDTNIIFDNIENICQKYNLTKIELLIRYSLSFDWISGILFGVDSFKQLEENINLFNKFDKFNKDLLDEIKDTFKNIPKKLTDPRLW
jgi:aryl-alcohol dehydrogenase-like predicted oxidoreductase